ncbi:MAG: hypothetical protein QUU85_10740, partial [Candidatus Eisenbacteria bacterium]|nr:hypothetical protein [Candidatus Eisenbacteria bacterium]
MPFRTLRWLVPLVLLLLAGAGAAAQARAQGFGQNKVQYKDLDWAVLETDHFLVHFYSSEREAAVDGARMAERAYTRLSTILRHDIEQKIPLILYASPSDFQTTNISPELIGEGTGGFTEYQKRRVTLPFTGGYDDLDHVLTHELVHAFQVDILFGSGDRGLANPLGTPYVPPLWFMEGMAEYLSVTKVDNLTEMWLRDASLQGYLIPLDVLSNVYDIRIYRFGQSIFSYIGATFGDDRIGELLKRVASTRSAERAFQDVLGMTLERFSDDWMENVRKTYLPTIAEHHKPEDFARRLTDAQRSSASYHLAPAVSPNGADMVYLSDHSLYNALYLASALDGRVQKRLIQGERRAEFESLRFLNASMDFSPDGKTVAFAAKAGARDAIYLQRLRDGKILRKIDFPLDGIQNPSFSNDGDWIVFVGLDGGRSDLYRCRVDGRDYERLTNDRFLAQSPRFSPDDRSILFVTDQGPETDFRNLLFSKPTLAILDLPSGRITPLPGMTGSNTAPHYFPDGRHILYVSDRTGIPNLYVRDLASHADARITDILTGVTGIIPLAPAVSLARDGSRCVFSCFTRGSWDLYAIKDPLSLARFDVARGEAAGESEADSSAGIAAPPPASPGPLTASRDPLAPSHGPDSRAPEPEPAQAPSLDSAGEPDTLASV